MGRDWTETLRFARRLVVKGCVLSKQLSVTGDEPGDYITRAGA